MIFGKKKKVAALEKEEVVIQNPVAYLNAATNRLWTAMSAMDQAGVEYESAVLHAHDNELEKYDKAITAARQQMKTAQFCVREVFGTLLEKTTHEGA